jgi:hypothetical protein
MIYAQAAPGKVAGGRGDSGGPVFSLLPASHVQARGEAVYVFDFHVTYHTTTARRS